MTNEIHFFISLEGAKLNSTTLTHPQGEVVWRDANFVKVIFEPPNERSSAETCTYSKITRLHHN